MTTTDARHGTTDGGAVLTARDVRKVHGHGTGAVVALDGVDLDVRRGELLVVRGPSGSGKTTLLHCLAGIAAPDAGSITIGGDGGETDLATLGDDARADVRAARMGLVFQTLNLLPALTVSENVQLPLVLAGAVAEEIRTRSSEVIAAVGLEDRADAIPAELSGGEQQRVAVARALVNDPEVVLADEPTGSLDSEAEQTVLGLLRDLVDPQRAVVVVSHSVTVSEVADRVVELRDGRVV